MIQARITRKSTKKNKKRFVNSRVIRAFMLQSASPSLPLSHVPPKKVLFLCSFSDGACV